MFVQEWWRGQRAAGWHAGPPPRPVLLLPSGRKEAASALLRPGGKSERVAAGATARSSLVPSVAPVPSAVATTTDTSDTADVFASSVPSSLVSDGGRRELPAWKAALTAAPSDQADAVLRSRPERPVDCSAPQWASVMVDSITARQRAMSFLAAQQSRDLMELAATAAECPDDPREFLGCELGLAMGVADSTASGYILEAIDLATRCPATFAALEAGDITPMKAATIRNGTQDLTGETTALVEADVLPGAGRCTMPQLRNKITKSVIRRDPVGADHRHEKATARRKVGTRPEEDGMALLWVYGTAQDIGTIYECLDALAAAAKTDGDTRLVGERRVDALVDVCADVLARGAFADRPLPEQQRRRPQLLVTIPATALLGDGKGEVADLAGYGPITPGQAKVIAADATWRRLVCDPITGALLDYGRTTYSPPTALRDFVLTRDKTCVMPGCRQPAHRCDIDHRKPFHPGQATGGSTSASNCSVLCRRHHRAKDHGGYRLHRTPAGDHHWTTPLGRSYLREATRLWDPPDKPRCEKLLDQLRQSRARWYDPDDPPPF